VSVQAEPFAGTERLSAANKILLVLLPDLAAQLFWAGEIGPGKTKALERQASRAFVD
jgi:hypothetical protein